MLVRKLKQKYIDNNTAFATVVSADEGATTMLLQNNFLAQTQPNSSRRNTQNNAYKTVGVGQQVADYGAKTRYSTNS